MNKKGFTLAELLGVITILAIIALIAIPSVTNVIEKNKQKQYDIQINNIEVAANNYVGENIMTLGEKYIVKLTLYQMAQDGLLNLPVKNPKTDNNFSLDSTVTINCLNDECDTTFEEGSDINYYYDDSNYASLKVDKDIISNIDQYSDLDSAVTITSGTLTHTSSTGYVYYELSQSDGKKVSLYLNYKLVLYQESILNGADPVISEGMIPVVIADDGTVTKADLYRNWYNYENKRWANMVLVNEASRSNYVSAKAGTAITSTDILAYFVWIPRYKYQLFNAAGTDSTTPQEIQITFENKETTKSLGTTNEEWLTHPAFTFDTEELNGIWVAKFETTGTASTPTVLPNVPSLRSQTVSQEFATSQLFNNTATYGINNDAHMAKNSEWGATSYLTQSKYGRCTGGTCIEVSINNSSSYITGSSAGRPGDSTTSSSTVYAYNTANGYLASTTGNITGIFDMSGGSYEYIMGNYNNTLGSSGFASFPIIKYCSIYTGTTAITGCKGGGCYGDALSETAGWYGDYQTFVNSSNPWFIRGGSYSSNSIAGLWTFHVETGNINDSVSFRQIILSA